MEFYLLTNTYFGVRDAMEALMEREPLINFDAAEFPNLHFVMMTLKCFVASYGVKNIVPPPITIAVASIYLCCKLIWRPATSILLYAIAQFTMNCISMYCSLSFTSFPWVFSALMWQVSSLNFGFKIFLDVLVVTTVLCYIFQTFSDEYEKGCALACYLYCLNYLTDYVVGNDSVGMYHAAVTVYLPVFVLSSFSPVETKRRAFFPIIVLTLVCLSLKLMKVLLANGRQELMWGVKQEDFNLVKCLELYLVANRSNTSEVRGES